MGDVQIYVADALAEKVAIRRLVAEVLAADATPPRSPGIVLDGMRLGIRADDFDVWWHSHLTTPLNGLWLRARQLLDANMPTCTVAIQSAHQWTEAS